MIFDYLYTLPNATSPDQIAVQTASAVNSFVPFFLLFIWGAIFLFGTNSQRARLGTADYPMWAVTSSLIILILSSILSITTGLMNLEWLVVILIINFFCGAWLFLDRKIIEG